MSFSPVGTSNSLNDQVAEEVRAAMARFELTQADLTPVLHVSQQQVSARLRRMKPFTLSDIEAIAEFFSTTPAVLMGFADEPKPQRPDLDAWYTARDSNPEPAD